MLSFKLYSIGNKLDTNIGILYQHYEKLLRPYAKISHQRWQLKNPDKVPTERLLQEEKLLLKASHGQICVLAEEGKSFSSNEFSIWLEKQALAGHSEIAFLLGGALGLSKGIKEKANLCLSLSHLTFPHDMALLVLVEQLYRAMTISHNKTYHY